MIVVDDFKKSGLCAFPAEQLSYLVAITVPKLFVHLDTSSLFIVPLEAYQCFTSIHGTGVACPHPGLPSIPAQHGAQARSAQSWACLPSRGFSCSR